MSNYEEINDVISCDHCSEMMPPSEARYTAGGVALCDECFRTETTTCVECKTTVYKEHCTELVEGGYVCGYCVDTCHECDDCGEMTHYKLVDVNGGQVCPLCLEEHYESCTECGEYHKKDDMYRTAGDDWICSDCFEESYFVCRDCDDIHHNDEATQINPYSAHPRTVCESCRDGYVLCIYCGDYYTSGEGGEDSAGDFLCDNCYESHYHTCEDCGEFVSSEDVEWYDGDPYCLDCYNNQYSSEGIHDYNWEPDNFQFHGNTDCYEYFGLELEMDRGGYSDQNANDIINQFTDDDNYAYAKSDGSLNSGFEIVTMPATLEYIKDSRIGEACDRAVSLGYRAHDTRTCGLHVHLDRRAFDGDIYNKETNIAKFVYLMELFWDKVVTFSRRSEDKLDEWADRVCGYDFQERVDDRGMDYLYRQARDRGKYVCVNLCHGATVEVRLFKGTLKANTIIASIQFVKLFKDFAISTAVDKLSELRWMDVVNKAKEVGMTEFVAYCHEREGLIDEDEESEQNVC